MQITFLLLYLFIFLLSFYVLSKDDFLFLKKNISMEQMFNIIFALFFLGLLFSRIFFIIFNFKSIFLQPLVFLAFIYYPGFSLAGGFASIIIFAYFYLLKQKIPIGKSFDFFSISFLSVFGVGLLIDVIINFFKNKNIDIERFIIAIIFIIIFFFFIRIILPFQRRGELRDGSIALMFISLFSLIYFLIALFIEKKNLFFLIERDGIFWVILFVFSSLLFFWNESLWLMIKNVIISKKKKGLS
ncbi:hypothetical protein LBMAG33_4000 [Candidatus Levyibacteriota bacterium]|nr:hypothetical protein [Candidatus Levybacteria bacterium]MSU25968.1 hypothetical protein [Candidatus Levybacteria bacterium]GDX62090.1 hypothetical protein LBMAG33_4000 [Candidatus Levybacteria bacterium]